MADVITRLKVESTEYDSKIKRASQGLLQMEQACRKVGGTLAILEKDELEFVKGLGKMETVSKDARGQLNELTKAFTDLSLQYKRLTDEEKKGDFGKALASSLGELKSRIQETKGQLSEISGEINGGGGLTGALDQLAGKFGLNLQQLAGWGAAIGAAKVALDVAKDAFFASEATVDEWGRTMDANKSLYEGFLTAINTGDISGYLSRIDEIVSAARTAYNELDRLGTMKTIQAPQMSAQQTENDRIRQMIQTGRYIAPLDGRKPAPGMKEGQLLTPEQIRTLERQLQNGMKTVVGLIGNEVKQTGKAIDAVYERQANELGMSLDEFRKGTSSMAEFDKRMQNYQRYLDYEHEHSTLIRTSYGTQTLRDNTANPYEGAQKWATFRVDGERYNELVQLILQRDQQAAQAYGMQSQAYRAINRAEGITTRTLLGGGDSGSGKTSTYPKNQTELQQNEAAIAKLTEEYQNLATAAKSADDAQKAGMTERMTAIQGEIKTLQDRNAELKKFADEAKGVKVEVDVPNSLPQLTKQLKDLQHAQSQSLDTKQWVEYQKQIDVTNTKIEILKGKWKEGQVATFSFEEKQPDKMVFTADNKDVLTKLAEIREAVGGIEIDEKTLTVTANTAEAVDALRKIDGLTIQPKEVSFLADNAEVLEKLREVNGVSIDDKTLTVTANTAEAADALRKIDELTVQPKEVSFLADNAEVLEKLREVNGVSIDDKTLTVTANTAEAVDAIRKIDGLTIQPKEVSFLADNAEVLEKLRGVNGVSIDDKTLTVTANTAEAADALRKIDELTVQPKEVSFLSDNAEVLDKLREVNGVSIDEKTLTVTANTAEAYNKVQELIGGIEGTTVSFEVKPEMKSLPTLDDYRIQTMIEIDAQETKVDTETLHTLLKDAIQNGIDTTSLDLTPIAEQIGEGINVPDETWRGILDQYNELREQIGLDPIQVNLETGKNDVAKQMKGEWNDAAGAVQSLGSALQGIEDPAAKVMGIIAQAIATVALTFSKSLAGTITPWDWIAAAAAGTATMISTITAIKSATSGHYAEGGIVPGNDYTDNTPIMVSSGELILNRSQQDNLASQMMQGSRDGQVAPSLPFVTADKIVLGINNWARSNGYGHLIFSQRQ